MLAAAIIAVMPVVFMPADGVVAAEPSFRDVNAGKIITVLGLVDPAEAGVILPHEHLFIDFRLPLDDPERWRLAERDFPDTDDKRRLWKTPITLDRLGFLITNIWSVEAALVIDSFPEVLAEAAAFRNAGGGTIVDLTNNGLGRDARRLEKLSRESGLHIVMGSGWYRDAWRPESFETRSVESLTDELVSDIVRGVDGTGVRAGIIGEIPAMTIATKPADSGDVKQLRAAARASRITGAAITLHQWIRDGEALPITLDILEEEGADLSRVIVGHIAGDAVDNLELLESVLARGVTLEFDLFGVPFYLGASHLDNRRMTDAVIALAAKGYAGQLLLSHDVCTKLQQKRYGGKGYDYVLTEVSPYLRRQGVSEAQLRQMLVENPARLLAIAPPATSR